MRIALACVSLVATGAAALGLAVGQTEPPPPSPAGPGALPGWPLYNRLCLPCHGEAGDGAGPAAPWLFPKPRDFTAGRYKWRSTASGQPPTRADLVRAIEEGAPGTSMPAFRGLLTPQQIEELADVLEAFAPRRFAKERTVVTVPRPPASLELLARGGAELFDEYGCVSCHGKGGRGDGPSAAALVDDAGRPAPPFDLTARPLRRGQRGAADVYLTLATGLDGTPMPAYAPALSEGDLWALAAYVDEIRYRGDVTWDPTAVDDHATKGQPRWSAGLDVPAQGEAPPELAPAVRSLSPAQCGRCHARQLREWRETIHAHAASPGTLGQFPGKPRSFVRSCQKCHAPLREQLPGEDAFDFELQKEGITCASCHVRGYVRRGPPRRAGSGLLSLPGYPVVEDAAYERSDFCLPCHQLPPTQLVNGKPLLNTYREWLEGPYMPRGIQCQHCHMPNREHTWKGVHDPETVRQGVDVKVWVRREGGGVRTHVAVENVGAGHNFPTTPTPAGWLVVELWQGQRVVASERKRIGRHIEFRGGKWIEHEDTRIPPGKTMTFAPRFGRAGDRVRVTLEMHPDDFYEGFYRNYLRRSLTDGARRQIEAALARARASKFVVLRRVYRVPR